MGSTGDGDGQSVDPYNPDEGGSTSGGKIDAKPQPYDPDAVVGATVSPGDSDGAVAGPPPVQPSAAIKHKAEAALAKHLMAPERDVKVVKATRQTWDASLGCGLPGRAYAEFAQYGYQLTIDVQGKSFTVSSNQDGSLMILCRDKKPELLVGKALP